MTETLGMWPDWSSGPFYTRQPYWEERPVCQEHPGVEKLHTRQSPLMERSSYIFKQRGLRLNL